MTSGRKVALDVRVRGEAFWQRKLNGVLRGITVHRMARAWTRYYMKRKGVSTEASSKTVEREGRVKRSAEAMFDRLARMSKRVLASLIEQKLAGYDVPSSVEGFVRSLIESILDSGPEAYRNALIYFASLPGEDLVETISSLHRRKEALGCAKVSLVVIDNKGEMSVDVMPST